MGLPARARGEDHKRPAGEPVDGTPGYQFILPGSSILGESAPSKQPRSRVRAALASEAAKQPRQGFENGWRRMKAFVPRRESWLAVAIGIDDDLQPERHTKCS